MKVDEIREVVERMRLTTPEADLLACTALSLAELLDSVIEILESVNVAGSAVEKLTS